MEPHLHVRSAYYTATISIQLDSKVIPSELNQFDSIRIYSTSKIELVQIDFEFVS